MSICSMVLGVGQERDQRLVQRDEGITFLNGKIGRVWVNIRL